MTRLRNLIKGVLSTPPKQENNDCCNFKKRINKGTTLNENINKRVVMSGDNLINAKPSFSNQTNESIVSFTLDRVGSKKFGRVTTDNVGKRMAIILDNQIISAPVIRETQATWTRTLAMFLVLFTGKS